MISVLIADDQNFVRKTLESYLEFESDLKGSWICRKRSSGNSSSRNSQTRHRFNGH